MAIKVETRTCYRMVSTGRRCSSSKGRRAKAAGYRCISSASESPSIRVFRTVLQTFHLKETHPAGPEVTSFRALTTIEAQGLAEYIRRGLQTSS